MSYFDTSNRQDEDHIEITDLDPQDGSGSGASLSIVLLRLTRKVPLLDKPQSRFTILAWLVCVIMLLFLVQPGLPDVPRQIPITSARNLEFPLAIINTTSEHNVIWIKVSHGKVIVIQAGSGRIVWHRCKVQRWFIPPKYAHSTVVICT